MKMTLGIGRILSTFCQRWANACLPTTNQVRYLYILPMLGQRWANSGFYSRCHRTMIGDFVKLSNKLFIMVCPKIIL